MKKERRIRSRVRIRIGIKITSRTHSPGSAPSHAPNPLPSAAFFPNGDRPMIPPIPPPSEEPTNPQPSPETSIQAGEPAETPEAPPDHSPRRRLTCWYCDSADLTKNMHLSFGIESGYVGLRYAADGILGGIGLRSLEPLRVTICNECGTVVRISVKEPRREWK
jgi:hypothetical protein